MHQDKKTTHTLILWHFMSVWNKNTNLTHVCMYRQSPVKTPDILFAIIDPPTPSPLCCIKTAVLLIPSCIVSQEYIPPLPTYIMLFYESSLTWEQAKVFKMCHLLFFLKFKLSLSKNSFNRKLPSSNNEYVY